MIEARTLIVMAKPPVLGKQRLAMEIGATQALEANRALHALTLREAIDPCWRTLLCVTPDEAVSERVAEWPDAIARIAQGEGDLGERLARALTAFETVAVIGADCPLLARSLIDAAFDALRHAPFALGLTEDGGFWILAARDGADAARAMSGVRWSCAHTSADVLRNLGADVAMLPTLYDVDTGADLARWRRQLPA